MAGVQWARQIVNDNAPANAPTHLGQPWALRSAGDSARERVDRRLHRRRAEPHQRQQSCSLFEPTVDPLHAHAPVRPRCRCLCRCSTRSPTGSMPTTQVTDPGGAEDAWYLAQPIPGLAANAPVRRSASCCSARRFAARCSTVCVPSSAPLDAPTAVNVNTASPGPHRRGRRTRPCGCARPRCAREQKPLHSIADFRARLPRPDIVVDDTAIDVRSSWFEVSIEARQGDTVARARALLQRSGTVGQWPVVVWQTVE